MMRRDLKNFFSGKKVLVTGNTGFKGSWLSEILLSFNAEVFGLSLPPKTNPNLFSILDLRSRMKTYTANIVDKKLVQKIIKKEKPEIIFHLAAQPLVRESYKNPHYTFEVNSMGTVNILEAVRRSSGVRSVICVTSDKVYKEKPDAFYRESDSVGGSDPYGGSKASAEIAIESYTRSFFSPQKYGRSHQTLVASVRAGNVIGGGDWSENRLIPDIIRAIFEKKGKVILRNPKFIRPWQFVLEPIHGYMEVAKVLYDGKTNFSKSWNFGPEGSSHCEVEKIVKDFIRILGMGEYTIEENDLMPETKMLKLDIQQSKEDLFWWPTLSLEKSLALTVGWYTTFYKGESAKNITQDQIKLFFEKSCDAESVKNS